MIFIDPVIDLTDNVKATKVCKWYLNLICCLTDVNVGEKEQIHVLGSSVGA